ncbi:MAG: hypothetical protein JWO10_1793 [Microbacteriaceae bacterium]|nr:hypothetical protein [Microbacteriaceae bacterium]
MSNETVARTAAPLGTASPTAVSPRTAGARLLRVAGRKPGALAFGLIGFVVSFVGSWIPSFWGDEAASVMSAERPFATLWSELGKVDAVHGTYYVFLHLWIDVFGASEISVRFPSAVAAGIAVAGVFVLGRMLFTSRIATLSAIVMAVLPRVFNVGSEARSYAIGIAIAAWLTVLLLALVRRGERRLLPWLAYGVLLSLGIYVFLYLVLLAAVHALFILSSSEGRMHLKRWFIGAALAAVLATPVLILGLSEHDQIGFLAHRSYVTFYGIFVQQWFGNWFAAPAWVLVILGIVAIVRRHRSSAVLVISWAFLPMVALVLGDRFVAPMFNLRYVAFSTPAVALLMATGLWMLVRAVTAGRSRRIRSVALVVGVVVLVGLSAPDWVGQRQPYAKDDGSDLREVAEQIAAVSHPGDAVVFEQGVRPSRRPRLGLHLYPQDYAGLKDVALLTPYAQRAWLWDTVSPLDSPATKTALAGVKTIWSVQLTGLFTGDTDDRNWVTPTGLLELERQGYSIVREIPVNRTTIFELTNGAA